MGKLSQFRLDKDKSIEGVWCTFAAGIEIKIARMNNDDFNRYHAEISDPYLNQIRRKTADKEIVSELMKKAVARCIIKDWRNMEDDDGKNIKYTPEKALEIISDPANLIFYEFVLNESAKDYLFFEQQKEDAVKN